MLKNLLQSAFAEFVLADAKDPLLSGNQMPNSSGRIEILSEGFIYKICSSAVWQSIQGLEHWSGSADDLRDGFIHFSGSNQVLGTLKKHFFDQTDLVLISIDPTKLSDQLRWESSRGGELFPHLYGPLPLAAVAAAAIL